MKTPRLVCALMVLKGFTLLAQSASSGMSSSVSQTTPSPLPDTPYAVISRDAHNTVWESTYYEAGPDGQWLPHIHRYQETATGLNFWNSDTSQWEPSSEQIEQYPGGAVARHGQHKVIFANDLAAADPIDLQTPDGQELHTRLLGLSYLDTASGQSVLIAEITNCLGQIIGSNQVWYDGAFCGVKAGVRYTYTQEGFEQDIILEESPPAPKVYGLNSSSTVLQALTEFISPPTPVVSTEPTFVEGGFQLQDRTLQFGTMKIGHGRAFLMGNDSQSASVTKEWLTLDGRQFLVEEVPVAQIAGQLQTLPSAQSASLKTTPNSVLNVVSSRRLLPPQPLARVGTNQMKVAAIPLKNRGFVLDYTTINTSQTNYVFQGDTTYYISGNVVLTGTNTSFEGGAVLKYATGVSLTVDTPVTWLASPYHPTVMVAKDDNADGESINGSTGNPGNAYYATVALYFDGTSALTNLTVENLRIVNAQAGIVLNGQSNHVLNDVQLVKCGTGIAATNTSFGLHNALMYLVMTNFGGTDTTAYVEQMTSDTAAYLYQNIGTNVFLVNCLLAGVTNVASCATQNVAIASSPVGVFETVGAGSHYLAGTNYLNAGTTNLSTAMLAALQRKTVYPPIVFSNVTISVATNFSPQALRDTGIPALGWHYDPLDYVFSGVTANANLTFNAGTATGYFEIISGNGYGIELSNDVTNAFSGTETAPCVFCRYDTVQEGNGNWTTKGSLAGITTVGNSSNFAEIDADFTHCYAMSWDPNHFRDYLAKLNVHANNCEFCSGDFAGYWLGMFMTNCLFDRISQVGSQQKSDGLFWRNCTVHGCQVFALHSVNWPVWIENCAFDGSTTNMDGNTNMTYCNYNAFVNGAKRLVVLGTNDFVTNTFTWQTGPLGNWYQAANCALIDAGSVPAPVVGLYHFTTQTNQAIEGDSQVDIGYHYVALDSSGDPLDTNGDGIPDYLEDSNGDGIYDAGDVGNWQGAATTTFSNGASILILEPKPTSQIP